jgi:phenylalanyl-tRNA synthetase beta chain
LINTTILKHFSVSQHVVCADFNWDAILNCVKNHKIKFNQIPKHPAVRRDFALLINDNITFDAIYKLAKQTEKQLLKTVNLFDV